MVSGMGFHMADESRGKPARTTLKTFSKHLEELDATLAQLYGLVEKSSNPLPVIQKMIERREALLIRGTIATKLLTALKTQRRRKAISSDFYERKQRHLMEELRQVDEALASKVSEIPQSIQQ